MRKYQGYLIDLDGTMYMGTERIPEAADFIRKLNELNIPYLFVTNNSTRTPAQVAEKLRSFSIPAEEEQVFTTSMATANYIYEQKKDATVYLIGEEGLKAAMDEKGFAYGGEHADYVVIGLDREISYEKAGCRLSCRPQRCGIYFHECRYCSSDRKRFYARNGSLTSVISVSTQTEPVFIGKPEPIIMEQALKVLGTDKEHTIMVGTTMIQILRRE